MKAFLDFEASSLEKGGFPVEVGWVLQDGAEEAHLIRPAPDWTVWSEEAEAIHRLSRARLEAELAGANGREADLERELRHTAARLLARAAG